MALMTRAPSLRRPRLRRAPTANEVQPGGTASPPLPERFAAGSMALLRRLGRVWSEHERVRLGTETALSALLVILIVVLSLPGPPRKWAQGVEAAFEKPLVLIPLAAVFLSGLLWCIRTWVLRRRIREPGPIQLVALEDATVAPPPAATVTVLSSDGAASPQTAIQTITGPSPERTTNNEEPPAAPVARLSVHLRHRLQELELTAPTAMPGRPMSTDFVELLGTTKLDLKQPLAAVGKLLRIVLPTHAYELRATLLRGDEAPQFGITVELTTLGARHPSLRTFWAASWEQAIDRATSAIGALVVPLSRRSERGPWCTWHGKTLDDDIFDAYQRFQRLSRERRHEEAIAALYAALRLDPANYHLRFQLGLLQEELALYLDALLTYHSIRQGLKERIEEARNSRERHAFQRLELLARYRATVLLGWGERLAEQWVPASHARAPSKRSRELAELRDQLRPILLSRYAKIDVGPWDRQALGFKAKGAVKDDIKALLEADPDSDPVALPPPEDRSDTAQHHWRREVETAQAGHRRMVATQLRLLLQLCALHDVQRFLREYTDAQIKALDTEITPVALRLLPAWARVRAQSARHALLEGRGTASDGATPLPPPPTLEGQDPGWPLRPDAVRQLWAQASAGWDVETALTESDAFLDHYNAACTFAVALLQERRAEGRRSGKRERDLAEAAVAELQSAVRVGGSEKTAAQWDWILREDPDLSGVRAEPEFRQFESERFPSSEPSPVRPAEIVRLVAARHCAILCRECAAQLERQWHSRADNAKPTDAHEALRWWEEERGAWRLARNLSLHHRHWQTRLDVIKQMQRFCEVHDLGDFVVPKPAFSDERIDATADEIDKAARREMEFADARIRSLDRELERHGHERYCQSWERYLQRVDMAGRTLDTDTVRRLSVNRASAWGELRVAFGRRLDSDEALRAARREVAAATGKLAGLPAPLSPAGATAGGRRRLLVVADRTLDAGALRAELARRARHGTEIHIVAPTVALNDRYDASDVESELERARARIRDALEWAHERGIRATGTVGDPDLAMGAITDEIASSGADEILVATLPRPRSNWLRNRVVERLDQATDVPVTALEVDLLVRVTVTPPEHVPDDVVVPSVEELHAFLKQRVSEHVSPPDTQGCVDIGVTESPEAIAAAIRKKISKHRAGDDSRRWVGVAVTTDAPAARH